MSFLSLRECIKKQNKNQPESCAGIVHQLLTLKSCKWKSKVSRGGEDRRCSKVGASRRRRGGWHSSFFSIFQFESKWLDWTVSAYLRRCLSESLVQIGLIAGRRVVIDQKSSVCSCGRRIRASVIQKERKKKTMVKALPRTRRLPYNRSVYTHTHTSHKIDIYTRAHLNIHIGERPCCCFVAFFSVSLIVVLSLFFSISFFVSFLLSH